MTDEAIEAARLGKQRWKIVRCSCRCGGRWAWEVETLVDHGDGPWWQGRMSGCVCHHPWTLAMRAFTGDVSP